MKRPSTASNILQRLLSGDGKAPGKPTDARFAQHAAKGEMEVCFTSGGVSYYRYVNEQRIPAYRAMAARDVFAELEFRTTREMSLAYIDAMEEALNDGDLVNAAAMLAEYKARHNYITHIDLLYKLATVLYLDNSENPEDYDPVYAAVKIGRWKEEKEVQAFFLQTPLIEYLPFTDLRRTGLREFTALQRKSDLQQSKMLLQRLSPDEQNAATREGLLSLVGTLSS